MQVDPADKIDIRIRGEIPDSALPALARLLVELVEGDAAEDEDTKNPHQWTADTGHVRTRQGDEQKELPE